MAPSQLMESSPAEEAVPEFAPERINVSDVDAIRASLDEHGYVRPPSLLPPCPLACTVVIIMTCRRRARSLARSLFRPLQACVKDVASEAELQTARDMLWEHLEGRSEPLMRQSRPVGWKRGEPTTWIEVRPQRRLFRGHPSSTVDTQRC
jgi:hypothetical protein